MNVHIISNSLKLNSGFANVSKNLAKGLIELGHTVNMTGMETVYLPEYTSGYGKEYGYSIEQLPLGYTNLNEEMQIQQNIIVSKADVVICVFQGDTDLNFYLRAAKDVCKNVIFYPPVEGRNIPERFADTLRWLTSNEIGGGNRGGDRGKGIVVSQCFYGQNEMMKIGIDSTCIYHGYDSNIFKVVNKDNRNSFEKEARYCYYSTESGQASTDPMKLCEWGCYKCDSVKRRVGEDICSHYKEEIVRILKYDMIKDALGKKNDMEIKNGQYIAKDISIGSLINEMKGKFVYLGVFQNHGVRKRIERLLKAYSLLIKDNKQIKDRTILHLHTSPIVTSPILSGINLIKIIEDLGIEENVMFSFGANISNSWSEEAMNILFNSSDVNISASSSEGFGIATIQSMACGLPNIGPNCSSFTELIGSNEECSEQGETERGYLANIESWQMIPDESFRALVSESHMALLMKKIYVEDKCRKRFSDNAVRWVQKYSWDNVCRQWNELLTSL